MIDDRTYKTANYHFENAVKNLQNNLQYLVDKDKVSEKFIAIQNQIIKSIINYQNEVEALLLWYEKNAINLNVAYNNEYRKLKDALISFEAICIIHGVNDFPIWMNKGKEYLVATAVDLYHKEEIQIPERIALSISKLPREEKQEFLNYLTKEK